MPVTPDRSHLQDDVAPKKRREYKRKHKADSRNRPELVDHHDYIMTSDDEVGPGAQSDPDDDDPDGQFAFRRTAGCTYQAPLPDHCDDWPDGGSGDPRFRFSLNTFAQPDSNFFGYIRRRIGRGGRCVTHYPFVTLSSSLMYHRSCPHCSQGCHRPDQMPSGRSAGAGHRLCRRQRRHRFGGRTKVRGAESV